VSQFDYSQIPPGYYDEVAHGGNPIRRCWHLEKFERVLDCLPATPGQSLLDIGCFAGTFLAMLPEQQFCRQLGVGILPPQITYANEHYGTPFRQFQPIASLADLPKLDGPFDCITLIEVIEHLNHDHIRELLAGVASLLKPGGSFVLSTPNYCSTWPILERILNRLSDVSYEEQHLTRFTFFNFWRKLCAICPEASQLFRLQFRTTTHFLSPFLAWVNLDWACRISRTVPHRHWHFPFGNLVLMELVRTDQAV